MPENCQLVSAIFWIKASQLFSSDVILHLQHCAVIESEAQCSQYKFVAGRCSQPDLPYKLVLREGGVFTPHTREASISVKQFSYYAVTHHGDKADSRSFYTAKVFYRPYKGLYVWQVDFVVVRDIPPLPDVSDTSSQLSLSPFLLFSSRKCTTNMREKAGNFIMSNSWSLKSRQLIPYLESLYALMRKAYHMISGK